MTKHYSKGYFPIIKTSKQEMKILILIYGPDISCKQAFFENLDFGTNHLDKSENDFIVQNFVFE